MSSKSTEDTLPYDDELISKAQHRFDEIRVRNKERLSRLQNKSTVTLDAKMNSLNQVFSSLLYLSLMMHRGTYIVASFIERLF